MALQNKVSVILGQKGSGKTSLVKMLIDKERQGRGRLIILDTIGEYDEICPDALPVTLKGAEKFGQNSRFYMRYFVKNETDLTSILSICWNIGNLLIVIDESGVWQSPAYIPEGISSLLRYGRHKKLDMIWVARRPTELNRMVTAQADIFYVFHTHEPRDTQYLSATVSDDLANEASVIGRYQYVQFTFSGQMSRGKTNPLPKPPSKPVIQAKSFLDG